MPVRADGVAPRWLGIFLRSNPRFAAIHLEYHVQPRSLAAFGGVLDAFPLSPPAYAISGHPAGTAAMGTGDSAVVDLRLRGRGAGGLRVIAASVMPAIASGISNAPKMISR